MMKPIKIYLGTILNPLDDLHCDFIQDGALVTQGETILSVGEASSALKKFSGKKNVEIVLFEDGVILPPFFDMHFHWVQDHVREMPKENLLKWLKDYTWPEESKFKDAKYSKKEAERFFKRLVSTGTLGGACYSSLHESALTEAFRHSVGDFIIGNVLMTMNSPDYLSETKKEATQKIKKFSKKYKEKYAMTPRFAITTHLDVMKEGAKIAKKNRSFMQTHLSETENEIDFTLSLFPGHQTYTEIYKKAGMLSPKTIVGHGIYLSNDELKLLAKTKTVIAHCPTSNAPLKERGLGSGLFDFVKAEKLGVRWVLASDIGGGPYLSMFDVMRSFVDQNKKNKKATFVKALYRSTLAGAKVLGLEKVAGNFKKAKKANFIVIPRPSKSSTSAESLLKNTIMPYQNKRQELDQIVSCVFYHGKRIF